MRLDRLLALALLLSSRGRMTARELAERFEVSPRTILRDLDVLGRAGVPVTSRQGRGGGLGLMSGYTVDRALFSREELALMATALQGVLGALGRSEVPSALQKIWGVTPPGGNAEEFVVDLSPWVLSPSQEAKIILLRAAIRDCRVVSCLYVNLLEEYVRRSLEPMTLVLKGFDWFLFAFCREKNAFRLFKLARMEELCPESEKFPRRLGRYGDIQRGGRLPDDGGEPVRIRFAPRCRHRVEEEFDQDHLRISDDGALWVTCPQTKFPWLGDLVLSFGEDAEVLGPPSFRKSIAARVRKLAITYGVEHAEDRKKSGK